MAGRAFRAADDYTIGDITRNGRCRQRWQSEGIADSRK